MKRSLYPKPYFLFSSRGQTIFEILIALTLIALFLTGVVIAQLTSIRNTTRARDESIATRRAREQMERVRVARDLIGLSNLYAICSGGCYIDTSLNPQSGSSPGVYKDRIVMDTSQECPLPPSVPNAVAYRVTATSNWGQGATSITPAPEVKLTSCITNWR